MLPAHIIEQLRERERLQRREQQRPQPQLEIPPPPPRPRQDTEPSDERGVVIIPLFD